MPNTMDPGQKRLSKAEHYHHPIFYGTFSLRQDLTPLENLTFCKEDVSPEEGQGPAVPFPRVHPHSHVSSSACNYSVEENYAMWSPGALGEQSQ